MAQKLRIVLLGTVILGGLQVNAMEIIIKKGEENKPSSSSLSLRCSSEFVPNEQFVAAKALNNLDKKQVEKNNTANLFYPWPGGKPIPYNLLEEITHSNGVVKLEYAHLFTDINSNRI